MAVAVTRVGPDEPRDAEVRQPRATVAAAQDVGRGHVAVHHPAFVHVGERVGDLRTQPCHLRGRDRAAFGQARGQRWALDQLEHDEGVAVLLAGVVHLHETGVVQRRQHPDLRVEAGSTA